MIRCQAECLPPNTWTDTPFPSQIMALGIIQIYCRETR